MNDNEECICTCGTTCEAEVHNPQPCSCCLGIKTHADWCVEVLPPEFVIEDGVGILRAPRPDDFTWPRP